MKWKAKRRLSGLGRQNSCNQKRREVCLSLPSLQQNVRTHSPIPAGEEEEEEEEEASALEHSMISDYESKLSAKREEVAQLLREREELKATHNRLLALQKKMHTRQVGLGNSFPAFSPIFFFLSVQLSDDPSKPNPEQDIASQTSVAGCGACQKIYVFLSDLTAATWGGSTVQSDPEEDTASSVSLPSDIVADITQDSVQNVGGKCNQVDGGAV